LVPAKSNSYYQAFNVKSLFEEIDGPKKSQVKLKGQIKHITNQDYPIQEVVEQSRMSRSNLKSKKPRHWGRSKVEDLVRGEKFKTATLGEIVSLEKSNKNVIGTLPMLQPRSSEVNSYYQAFNVKSLFGEIDCPKKSQVNLKGQIK
nr:hypothetical protein [Tanacetum cinerariifolium]